MRGPPVYDKRFVVNPIRDSINPSGPAVQKQDGNAETEQKNTFEYFEKGDQLEIANAILRPQNFEISCPVRHP